MGRGATFPLLVLLVVNLVNHPDRGFGLALVQVLIHRFAQDKRVGDFHADSLVVKLLEERRHLVEEGLRRGFALENLRVVFVDFGLQRL